MKAEKRQVIRLYQIVPFDRELLDPTRFEAMRDARFQAGGMVSNARC